MKIALAALAALSVGACAGRVVTPASLQLSYAEIRAPAEAALHNRTVDARAHRAIQAHMDLADVAVAAALKSGDPAQLRAAQVQADHVKDETPR